MKLLLSTLLLCVGLSAWSQCNLDVYLSVTEPECYNYPYTALPDINLDCPDGVLFEYQWSFNAETDVDDYPIQAGTVQSINEIPPASLLAYENNPLLSICLQVIVYDVDNNEIANTGYCHDVWSIYIPQDSDFYEVTCDGYCIYFTGFWGYEFWINDQPLLSDTFCFPSPGVYEIYISDPQGCDYVREFVITDIVDGNISCQEATEVFDQTVVEDDFCGLPGEASPAFPNEDGYKWYKINSGDFEVLNLSAITESGWPTLNVEVLIEQNLDDCSSLQSVSSFSGFNNQLLESVSGLQANTNYYIVTAGDQLMSYALSFALSNEILDQGGCTNESNCNYNVNALLDLDCAEMGCMDPTACNYNDNATCDNGNCITPETLVIQLYHDINGNNLWGQGGLLPEPAIGNIGSISVNELGLTLFPNSDGQVLLPADTPLGAYTLTFDPLGSPWTTAANSISMSLPSCQIMNLALIPDTEELVQISGPCCIWNMNIHCQNGFNPGLWVQNTGNVPFDGVFTMTFDSSLEAEDLSGAVPYTTFENGVMTWDVNQQLPGESFLYQTHIIGPGVDVIGNVYPIAMQFQLYNSDNELYTVGEWILEPMVTCAYDPNDKYAEPAGYEEPNFVLNGTEIEYRIRFQNTGNAPAETVVIQDQLDLNVLDIETFSPLFASHDFTTSVDASGKVLFTFDNIQLPDSSSDEPGSQGYVVYRITPIAELSHGEEINNFAEIYFDLNPAIVTNTYQHTIYECSSINTEVPIGGYLGCIQELINSNYEQDYIEEYFWEFDGNTVSNDGGIIDLDFENPGVYPVTITLSNPLCTVDVETMATISDFPSNSLSFDGETIAASEGVFYQWYFFDELIDGASEQTYTPTEPGQYTAVITNMNGCSIESEILVIAPNVQESIALDFKMFPNPATNQLTVVLPVGNWNMEIVNAVGQAIQTSSNSSGTELLDLTDLASGIYYLRINEGRNGMAKKLMVR